MRSIPRKAFRSPPPTVSALLASLAEYQGAGDWPRDCRALANAIADSDPFTIMLFYFMSRSKTYARGCSTSSGSREAHSYFGLAFLELARRGAHIPSHILVYDKHNRLFLADSLTSFALHPAAMGSNCSEPTDTVRKLMRGGLTVTATASNDYSEISEVQILMSNRGRW
jgi:hypothetical protein